MKTNVHPPRKKVNRTCTEMQHPGTRLTPLLLRRKGEPDQFFYAPCCQACGKVIFDFTNANVSTCGWNYEKPKFLAEFDGAKFYTLGDAQAFAFCKPCDRSENKPWTPADSVLKMDQRRSFEKGEL